MPWRHDGTWQHLMDLLHADIRRQQAPSHAPTPSAASLDSQTVKTPEQGRAGGDDDGKNLTGRTCPVRVATLGQLLAVVVTSTAIDDAGAAPQGLGPLGTASSPRVEVVWADRKSHHHARPQWLATDSPGTWRVEMVRRPPDATGFVLVPKRWVGERTCA